MNLKIKDILKCTNGKLIIGDTEKECKNYSKDTRTIITTIITRSQRMLTL